MTTITNLYELSTETISEMITALEALPEHDWRVRDEIASLENEIGERAEIGATFEAEFLAERGADYFYSGCNASDARFLAQRDFAQLVEVE